jgi:hypothetical protein
MHFDVGRKTGCRYRHSNLTPPLFTSVARRQSDHSVTLLFWVIPRMVLQLSVCMKASQTPVKLS